MLKIYIRSCPNIFIMIKFSVSILSRLLHSSIANISTYTVVAYYTKIKPTKLNIRTVFNSFSIHDRQKFTTIELK